MSMQPADLAAAAAANLAVHMCWPQQHTPGMYVDERDDLLLVDSGLPCDTFNVVCSARLAPGSADRRIREALAYFGRVGRPFSWWASSGDQPSDLRERLDAAGLSLEEVAPAMAADLERLEDGKLDPGGLQIRRVRTPAELADFARVVAANWSPPDLHVLRFYELTAPALLGDDAPIWLYVGYLGGEPVTASELASGGGIAGLYNVCTLAAHRRRGFGAAITLRPLLDARDQGYRTAILQSSPEGERIYARAGFVRFGEVAEFKPPHVSTPNA
jgi:GNAT superfamily N-acetyltransferase